MFVCVFDVVFDFVFDFLFDVVCVMLLVMMSVVVWVMMCDGVGVGEGIAKVEWFILCCFGVLVTDWQADRQTDE